MWRVTWRCMTRCSATSTNATFALLGFIFQPACARVAQVRDRCLCHASCMHALAIAFAPSVTSTIADTSHLHHSHCALTRASHGVHMRCLGVTHHHTARPPPTTSRPCPMPCVSHPWHSRPAVTCTHALCPHSPPHASCCTLSQPHAAPAAADTVRYSIHDNASAEASGSFTDASN
jgi:hypothetical protein